MKVMELLVLWTSIDLLGKIKYWICFLTQFSKFSEKKGFKRFNMLAKTISL